VDVVTHLWSDVHGTAGAGIVDLLHCKCGVAWEVLRCCGMPCGSARLVREGVESIKST